MNLSVLPVLIPLLTAITLSLGKPNWLRWINLTGSAASFVFSGLLFFASRNSGPQVLEFGSWIAPFGIVFVADLLSAVMVLITSFIGLALAVYLLPDKLESMNRNYFFAFQTLLMGVSGSFLTGDLFNLYVWFEVMLLSSFVLMVHEKSASQLEGGLKYTLLNLFASMIFLAGIAMIYSATGTLNMAELSIKIAGAENPVIVKAGYAFLLIAFGTKAGVFPLYFWLPASYHTPRFATSALLAGLLTKVGVYALIRINTLIFHGFQDFAQPLLLVIATLTMITGVLGAVSQFEIRRILSFHIISQIGYMILGLAVFTKASLAATVFYVLHHIIVKTNLFLIAGVVGRATGTTELALLGGFFQHKPFLSVLFLIPALSLAGLPPLSGFFAKLSLLWSLADQRYYLILGIALVVSILTLISMMKIWLEVFWKNDPSDRLSSKTKIPFTMYLPIAVLTSITLLIGLWPSFLMATAQRVSAELTSPKIYIGAVLGGDE